MEILRPRHETAREAVLRLYREQYAPLVRLARLLVRDASIAEDLVQDAFVRLYGAWGRIRDPEKAPAYLRQTVVNLARGRARREAVALRRRPDPPPDEISAEEAAAGRATRREVADALGRISPRQRECLVLRHWAGLSESEIADAVGVSVGSVRTHLKRGLAALEARLGEAARGAGDALRAADRGEATR